MVAARKNEGKALPRKKSQQDIILAPCPFEARPPGQVYMDLQTAFGGMQRPNFARAAKLAGCSVEVARDAWQRGWKAMTTPPEGLSEEDCLPEWLRPLPALSGVFERARLRSRAIRSQLHQKMMERSNADAVQAEDDYAIQRAIQGAAIRKGMIAADSFAGHIATIANALESLVESAASDIVGMAQDPNQVLAAKLSVVSQGVSMLERYTRAMDSLTTLEDKFTGDRKPAQAKPRTQREIIADLVGLVAHVKRAFPAEVQEARVITIANRKTDLVPVPVSRGTRAKVKTAQDYYEVDEI